MNRITRFLNLAISLMILVSGCKVDPSHPSLSGTPVEHVSNEPRLPGYVVKRQGITKRVLILVHGLTGNGKSSWTSANGTYWPDLMRDDPVFQDFDIYVYQFETRLFGNCLPITDIANNMRVHLKNDDVLAGHEQVVFMAHSMGGLVVRQFLLRNREDANKIPLAMFFATPTAGSNMADIARLVSACAQVDDLRTIDVNSYLKSQQSDWLSSGLPEKIVSRCAFETKPSGGFLTVDRSSATLLCSKDPEALPTDHSAAVKPNSTTDLSHIVVRNALKDLPFPNSPPLSPFEENRELRKQTHNLQDRLDQRYRNRAIREELGRFIKEGDGLVQKTFKGPPLPPPQMEANDWYRRARQFLLERLDSSYEARFVSTDPGLPIGYGLPQDYEGLISGIQRRLIVLRRFIEELKD
ncbi:MAG: hypothetical protein ABIQ79_04850 [Nitrospiraceae bacterium]